VNSRLLSPHDVLLFACSSCLSVRLSVIMVKSFTTWQHRTASGGFSCRLRYTFFTLFSVTCAIVMNRIGR